MASRTNERLYREVRQLLRHLHVAGVPQLVDTLALMIIGLFLGRHVQLPELALWVPLEIQVTSVVRRFERFLADERVQVRQWFAPFVQAMQRSLGQETAYLVIDCTKAGRRCRTIVVGLAYHGSILPVGWKSFTGSKGHLAGAKQREVLEMIYPYCRHLHSVVVLGDAEFSNEPLINWLRSVGWHFVFRFQRCYLLQSTAGSSWRSAQTLYECEQLQPGEALDWEGVAFTYEHAVPDLTVTVYWGPGEPEPWCLVSDLPAASLIEACYARRCWIECFFATLKSRGFDLARTHLTDPIQIDRLILALAMAAVLTLSNGTRLVLNGATNTVDRSDRRDLSLFQLGWRSLIRGLTTRQPRDLALCFRWDLNLPQPGFQRAA